MRCLLLSFALVLSLALAAQTRRYVETVFPSSTLTAGVVYGQAPRLSGTFSNQTSTVNQDLLLDRYEPTGDTHNQRAAIVFVHSGGFLTGNRNHDDMVALCDSFARKGYVTVTIDYRQGFFLLSNVPLHGIRAVYRGIQDGRTAVRYLRANAASLGIDPEQIYMWGSSAGSFIALHSIYLDDTEKPAEAGVNTYTDFFAPTRTTPDLGDIDAGSHPGFSGTPNGIVGMWGAVQSIDLVDATDDLPVFLTHGTADAAVPFVSGFPFSFPFFPTVFGSSPIADQLAINGTADYETWFVPGADHEFYAASNGSWSNGSGPNARWDTLLGKVTPFLWRQHKPTADFTFATNELETTFTNTSTGDTDWFWDFGDGTTSTTENPVHTYATDGTYAVELFIRNNLQSWDTLEQQVTVSTALPLVWARPLEAKKVGKQHRLSWVVGQQAGTSHFEVEHAHNDGDFRQLGQVYAAGDLADLREYDFLHDSPEPGKHLYRVRQIDIDGRYTYSSVAMLESLSQLGVFPNPGPGLFTLTGLATAQVVEVFGGNGQSLGRRPLTANGVLDLRDLPAGLYRLLTEQNAWVEVVKR